MHTDEMKQTIGVAKTAEKNNLIDNNAHKRRGVGEEMPRGCVYVALYGCRVRRG